MSRTVALGICGLITMSVGLPSSFATVPLYFPGQINVQVRQSTKALVHLDLGNGGLVEVVVGRDDGFLSLIESFGHGNFRSTVVFALAGEVVELAVHTPGPGPDRILVALTVNPDALHILSVEGGDPLFSLLASIDLDEDPGGLAGGPIAAGGEFGLAVTLPGVDRWVLVDETSGEWSISQDVHGGDRPVAVTLMDVNADQVPEVVTADSGVLTGALSIFQKDGEGFFQLTNQTVAPATLVYVTPFTTGSTQKLYVSYADSAFISVFEPQAGSLVESERIVSASPIDGLVVAELGVNRNGLWGWNRDSGVVQFFEEQFDVWQPIESYYCGGRAVDVDLHDLNNDSLLDLMVANGEAETVALLFANDSPSFRAYLAALVPSSPNDGLVMDEDLDGHLDYLVSSVGSSTVEFMRGDGRGHLMRDSQPLILDSPARTLTSLFADGDNLVDLAIVQSITNRITIMLRQPAGDYLEASSVSTGLGPFRLRVSDFDGDGFVDLLVGNEISDNITVAFGVGDGTFPDVITIPLPNDITELDILDLNADQLADIVLAIGQGSIATMLNLGNRVFGQLRFYSVGLIPVGLASVDLDGDLMQDVVVVKEGDDGLAVFENLGDGNLFLRIANHPLEGAPGRVMTSDLNLSGSQDIIVTYPGAGEIGVVLNVATWLFAPPQKFASALQPFAIGVGDFNEDDVPDLVTLDRVLDLALTMLNVEPNPIPVEPVGLNGYCLGDVIQLVFPTRDAEPWFLEGETAVGWSVLATGGVAHYGSLVRRDEVWTLVLSAADAAAAGLVAGVDGQQDFRLWRQAADGPLQAAVAGNCLDSGPVTPQPLLVLGSPHPNPFNPAVEFLFTLAAPAKVRAAVWDLAGYKVATLADRWFTAGSHRLQWDGRSHGKIAGAGTYLLAVTANGRTVSHKVTLLK